MYVKNEETEETRNKLLGDVWFFSPVFLSDFVPQPEFLIQPDLVDSISVSNRSPPPWIDSEVWI